MPRISTRQQNEHKRALKLLNEPELDREQKLTIFDKFNEGAEHLNGANGAFFTPMGLANDFSVHVQGRRIIDLCAGIGALSYACTWDNYDNYDLTCIELNQDYINVGKKLVPWAKWYCRDVLTLKEEIPEGKKFDVAIANPPFGNINGVGQFDLEVVRKASKIAKSGVFILPQTSTPFRYSGRQTFSTQVSQQLESWLQTTDIEFEFNCGIDCNAYIDQWKGVKPVVEIVICNFS